MLNRRHFVQLVSLCPGAIVSLKLAWTARATPRPKLFKEYIVRMESAGQSFVSLPSGPSWDGVVIDLPNTNNPPRVAWMRIARSYDGRAIMQRRSASPEVSFDFEGFEVARSLERRQAQRDLKQWIQQKRSLGLPVKALPLP